MKYHQKAIEINPNYANSYCNLGNVFKKSFKMKEAKKNVQKSILINPCFTIAYVNLIEILFQDKK